MRAGLCDGEGERAYTAYAPHYNLFASRTNVSSCLEVVSSTKTFRSNSTTFHSIPSIRSKGSTSVLSTRKVRPIYSHPKFLDVFMMILMLWPASINGSSTYFRDLPPFRRRWHNIQTALFFPRGFFYRLLLHGFFSVFWKGMGVYFFDFFCLLLVFRDLPGRPF